MLLLTLQFLSAVVMLFIFVVLIICIIFLISPITGALFVPTKIATVKHMIKLANIKKGSKAADIGSGDGRIVVALAKAGAEAHGYEVNPVLVLASRQVLKRNKLHGKAFIHWQDFWRVDFSQYQVVTVYGLPSIMKRLETKLRRELKPGSKVISHAFTFPTWKASQKVGNVIVYKR